MAELGFGTMRLPMTDPDNHGSVDTGVFRSMVDAFLDSGFGYFDTAYYYHHGNSERAVGSELVGRHPRSSFRLADKLPMKLLRDETDPKVQDRFLAEQQERCGTERFDRYMLHNVCRSFYPAAERLDSFGFLRNLKETGVADSIGFSIHDDADFLTKVLDENGDVDFVQLQINYVDWDSSQIQSRRCYEVAESRGIPVVVMEPVRGGALANLPEEAAGVLRGIDPEASQVSWALRFAAGLENVDIVLSGMSDMNQMSENMALMRNLRPLDDEESEALRRVADILKKGNAVPCTGCGYCLGGCPKDIPIPDYISLYNSAISAPTKGLPPQRFYYLNTSAGHGKASECIGCGRCEADCPQHIAIRDELSKVASLFERF